MTDVTKICVEGVTFFGLLNAIAVFVREPYLRINKWETTSKYKFISVIGETKWWAKDHCVTKVFAAFNNPSESLYILTDNVNIVETLDEIYCTQKFSSDVRFKVKTYLDSLLKYKTIIMSQIFLQIFTSTTPLSLYLQTKGLDIFNAFKIVKQSLSTLKMQSRDFEIILNATDQFVDWSNTSLITRGLGYNVFQKFLTNRIK
ncbi:Uncharacterized protein FWK35_00035333 [Aphis craccivora]|uniref:Uncharacterized protein n=1 Tax=Aphis craccivora TaxID=307492 RepID=A0A6G0VP34_APHCR|nr:Uncharacterized protein FWK35_00035333 [Aphis craccivora]